MAHHFLVVQIPSDKVPFNQLPEMKAKEITEAGKEALRSGKYKMVRQQVHDEIIGGVA
jgi:bisphosphoglycerate-independent phosphoglycerate mutase (AlkP superfamily)